MVAVSLKKTVYKFSGWEPSYIDIDNAKNEGIWNNDWDLSLELIKRYIKKGNLNLKVPPREEIVKCFEESYFGGDPNQDSKYWSGYITNEELLVDKKFFDLIQGNGIIWGFVSGAESASAKFVLEKRLGLKSPPLISMGCLLYTSDAADDSLRVDLGGRRIIKKNSLQIFRMGAKLYRY